MIQYIKRPVLAYLLDKKERGIHHNTTFMRVNLRSMLVQPFSDTFDQVCFLPRVRLAFALQEFLQEFFSTHGHKHR